MPTIDDDDLLPDERAMLEGKLPIGEKPANEEPAEDAAGAAAAEGKPAEGAAAADTPAPKEGEGADGEGSDLDADALAAVADGDKPAPAYEVPAVDFKAEKAKLSEKRSDVEKRWADGALTDDERAVELEKLQDERDALVAQEVEARTIENINRQNLAREQGAVLKALAESSTKAGLIDYSDAKNGKAFDNMLRAVSADEGNAGRSFAELAQMAHDALCAVRGVKPAAAAAQAPAPAAKPGAAAAPAPAAKPPVPQTLHGMPVAGAAPIGNDFLTTLAASDDPDAAEAALAALPASQRNALFRSTVATGSRR